MQDPKLPIHDMSTRHSGLTQDIAASLTEGARVCLDRHHQPLVTFVISDFDRQIRVVVEWEPPDERTKYAWANEIDTTEAGACACVLAAVELSDGLVAVRRAETGAALIITLLPLAQPLMTLRIASALKCRGLTGELRNR